MSISIVMSRHGRTARLLAAVVACAVAFALVSAVDAQAITRDQVLSRAQRRVNAPVPYSQSKYYAGYRTDCSGYVSSAWATGTSWATRSFHLVTHPIPVADLKPGDALLKKGYHIRLFYGWLDEEQTQYVAYESAYGTVAAARIHSIDEDLAFGYVPVRYDRITDSPAPRNVLNNGAFKTWARSWGGQADQPVWWSVENDVWWEGLASKRTDTYRTSVTSLELVNPVSDPETVTTLSQSVRIVPGAEYRTTVWAKTASDPAVVELSTAYLDEAGLAVAETTSTGTAAGLDPSVFRPITMLTAAPPHAVRARISIRLAGGGSIDSSGTTMTGTAVTLDDISLVRPQASATILASRRSARNGTRVTLSGKATPEQAIGAPATLWVKRPGAAWQRLATTTVSASSGAGAWKRTYTFKRSMRRGTYRFRVSVPAVPGHLGTTSPSVSVRLR